MAQAMVMGFRDSAPRLNSRRDGCSQGVHDMLVHVAQSLVAGGETGIFSPMHLLVFRKPLTGQ